MTQSSQRQPKGAHSPNSDIDLLVDDDTGTHGHFLLLRLCAALRELLGFNIDGRPLPTCSAQRSWSQLSVMRSLSEDLGGRLDGLSRRLPGRALSD